MATQTIKSAAQPRVNVGVTQNQAGARQAGHYDALCIAGAPFLQNDIFGRNVGHLGVDMRGGGAECNNYLPPGQTVKSHITRENLERPYVQIGPEGSRGSSDLMGKGRDVIPQDLYGTGMRGNFVRHGSPGLTIPDRRQANSIPPINRREQNMHYPTTHDTTSNYQYRG
jgi:hypothetical protein